MGDRYYRMEVVYHSDAVVELALQKTLGGEQIPKLAMARRKAEAVMLLFPKATVKLESVQHVPFYAVIPVTFKGEG